MPRNILGRLSKKLSGLTPGKYGNSESANPTDIDLLKNYLRSTYGILPNFSDDKCNITVVVHRGGHPSSSSFIRIFSPLLSEPAVSNIGLDIIDRSDLAIPVGTNVCIVSRNALADIGQAKDLVNQVRKLGISLIIDIDDAIYLLDGSFASENEALDYLVNCSDLITVSTEQLLMHYSDSSKVKLIINTNDSRLWPHIDHTYSSSAAKRLVYMGTTSHTEDLNMILPALDRLHDTDPGSFELTVIGVTDDDITPRPWMSRQSPDLGIYPEFVKWFVSQDHFDLGLAPLVDSEFNLAKSDIKCLDYIAAGIKPMVSDVPAYRRDDSLQEYYTRVQDTPDAWYEALRAEITEDVAYEYSSALNYIRAERDVSLHSQELLKAIREVVS